MLTININDLEQWNEDCLTIVKQTNLTFSFLGLPPEFSKRRYGRPSLKSPHQQYNKPRYSTTIQTVDKYWVFALIYANLEQNAVLV